MPTNMSLWHGLASVTPDATTFSTETRAGQHAGLVENLTSAPTTPAPC